MSSADRDEERNGPTPNDEFPDANGPDIGTLEKDYMPVKETLDDDPLDPTPIEETDE